nr:grasp-with-spasm system SPASM domain peptide maturase [uncultured Flavobacterium sp.]
MIKNIKFFEACQVVKGINQSIICDLQRYSYTTIPNDLFDVIKFIDEGLTVNEIKEVYNNKYNNEIEEYINFLISNEFAFFTNTPHFYPKISLEWKSPFKVNNAIIELNNNTNFREIIYQLNNLRCKNIEFRIYDTNTDLSILCKIISLIENECLIISNIVLVFPYQENVNDLLSKIISLSSRALNFIIYSAKKELTIEKSYQKKNIIQYIPSSIHSNKSCGCVHKLNFTINMEVFTESINHNTCLNRKISVDKDGNIKNCPSMGQSFGNIKNTTLEEAMNHNDFKKYWNVTKDQIEVCKDCEFRHICTDCRAYTERTNFEADIDLSKPLKCGYNPYTNEWAEWSTNPLKQNAIKYYGMQEIIKN